jgi:hypothetical protein
MHVVNNIIITRQTDICHIDKVNSDKFPDSVNQLFYVVKRQSVMYDVETEFCAYIS